MMRRIGALAVLAVLFLLGVCAMAPEALAFGDQLSVTIVRLASDGTATPLPGQSTVNPAVPIPNVPPGAIVGDLTPLPNDGGGYTNDVRGGDCSGPASSYSYKASSSSVSVGVVGNASRREARRKSRSVEKAVGFSAGVVGVYSGGSGPPSTGSVVTRSKSVERYRD